MDTKTNIFLKAIGFLFVLACPFIGGALPVMLIASHFDIGILKVAFVYTIVWGLIFTVWFDGSKLQKSLI